MDKTEIQLKAELKALHKTSRIVSMLPTKLKRDKNLCSKILSGTYAEALRGERQKKDEIVTITEIFKSEAHFKKYFANEPKKKEILDFIKRTVSEKKCVTWSTLRDYHGRKKHRSTFKRVIKDPFKNNNWIREMQCSGKDHTSCLRLSQDMEKFL